MIRCINFLEVNDKIYFAPDILKYEDNHGDARQEIIITLKSPQCDYPVISPATCMLKPWTNLKSKTIFGYAQRICAFLNYAYFEKRIKSFKEIDSWLVVDFLENLGQNHNRDFVLLSLNVLKRSFYYLTYNYENICSIGKDEIYYYYGNQNAVLYWTTVETNVVLPGKNANLNRKRKLKNLDDEIVIYFLNLAKIHAPNCVLGFYLLFYGGMRASEVCNLTSFDMPKRFKNNGFFHVNIHDKILNLDSKFSDLTQNKINRDQSVLIVPGLFQEIYEIHKQTNIGDGAIVRNRLDSPMATNGFSKRFNQIKKILIEELNNSDDAEKKSYAYKLSTYDWSTHIGRAYFSNFIASKAESPYVLSVLRGDHSFASSLPYLTETEKMVDEITNNLGEMYERCKGNL